MQWRLSRSPPWTKGRRCSAWRVRSAPLLRQRAGVGSPPECAVHQVDGDGDPGSGGTDGQAGRLGREAGRRVTVGSTGVVQADVTVCQWLGPYWMSRGRVQCGQVDLALLFGEDQQQAPRGCCGTKDRHRVGRYVWCRRHGRTGGGRRRRVGPERVVDDVVRPASPGSGRSHWQCDEL